MITINKLWQAIEIAEAAKGIIYRHANGYAVSLAPVDNMQYLTSFRIK